jgi:hypothetical protein
MNTTNANDNVLVEDFISKFEDELPPTWQNEAKLDVIQVWISMARPRLLLTTEIRTYITSKVNR